ncbi:hypothetical protein [Neolewinella sp.]|uniref:hypothetical protein n=1 Tax=Neolewinella sp. TaxID=2993543 RepID=UPI003B51D8C9
MSRYCLACFLLLCPVLLGAQTVDVRQFFRRGQLLLPTTAEATSVDRRPRTPFIDSYDLRTETDEYDYQRQEYTIRFNFSSPSRVRAQRAMYQQLLLQPPEDEQEATCERIEDLYRDWVQLYLLRRGRTTTDSLLLVLADRQRVAERYATALRGDPDDQFRLITDRSDLVLARGRSERREELLRTSYQLGSDSLDFTGFPTVSAISDELVAASTTASVPDLRTAYELALIDREIALEQAEERQLLDFLQLRYRANPRQEFREKFTIGLALRIRDGGDRKLKLRQLYLEKEQLEREGSLGRQLREVEQTVSAAALRTALDAYASVDTILQQEEFTLRRLARTVAQREDVDPRFLLKVTAQRLERELDRLDALERVLETYLEWRGARGELCTFSAGELL